MRNRPPVSALTEEMFSAEAPPRQDPVPERSMAILAPCRAAQLMEAQELLRVARTVVRAWLPLTQLRRRKA